MILPSVSATSIRSHALKFHSDLIIPSSSIDIRFFCFNRSLRHAFTMIFHFGNAHAWIHDSICVFFREIVFFLNIVPTFSPHIISLTT